MQPVSCKSLRPGMTMREDKKRKVVFWPCLSTVTPSVRVFQFCRLTGGVLLEIVIFIVVIDVLRRG